MCKYMLHVSQKTVPDDLEPELHVVLNHPAQALEPTSGPLEESSKCY